VQPQQSTGTREDANADPTGNLVIENPNATATKDRPIKPQNSLNPQRAPHLGPPNADEPPAVPQIGSAHVVGVDQPAESNPVSATNAAPYPARFHGDAENDGRQGPNEQLRSRAEQHAAQGVHDAASGAETTSEAVPSTKPGAKGGS
jgi:hypothetical protein